MDRFCTSFAQQRLWFLDQYEPGSWMYNIPMAWRVRGNLNRAALSKGLDEIVRRHEILRTTFEMGDDGPIQVVAPRLCVGLPLTDLCAQSDAEQRARRVIAEEQKKPFDLSEGPLLRAGLIKLAESDHIFLLTLHHVVADGWSIGLLLRELHALYGAFRDGHASPLEELPIQYADYAVWQRDELQGDALRLQLDYWVRTLSGAPPSLELQTDHPRPPVLTHRGSMVKFNLGVVLTSELRRLGRRTRVTPFMMMATTFAALLHRYSAQDDVCIGYPVANREELDVQRLIGLFVNTLVLRVRFEPGLRFEALLSQVRKAMLDARAHQHVPFDKVVEALMPERSVRYSPLFQVMISFQGADNEHDIVSLDLLDLEIGAVHGENHAAKFDLSLDFVSTHDDLACAIEYNVDLFDHSTIERMTGHLRTLLKAVISNPQTVVDDLPMLTPHERHHILVTWAATERTHSDAEYVHQMFEAQARKNAEAVALVCGDEQLTYGELNARANQVAHRLRELGVQPDERIAVWAERGPAIVVGLLGILKAGGAYVPLGPEHPADRSAYLLVDAGAAVVLKQDHLWPSFSTCAEDVICLDIGWHTAAHLTSSDLANVVRPQNLAYCIYTSGSTGKPNGVSISHAALTDHIRSCIDLYGISSTDRVLQFASTSFDAALEQLLVSLCAGATVYVREQQTWSPAETLDFIRSRQITVADIPTAYWHVFIADRTLDLPNLPLRLLIIGGEVTATHDSRDMPLPFDVINAYGPTEATITTSTYRVDEAETFPARYLPIGCPLPNTQMLVLDGRLNPVPIGVRGEIHIAGARLARGYLGRPDLTADRFVPNPYGVPGSRMYKTGDVGCYRRDGVIQCFGRLDNQVKIRGFRIELGEIETLLTEHADVRKAVVVVHGEYPSEKHLVAYVVPTQRGRLTIEVLRAHLQVSLPDYMVPSGWVFLEALPLNQNGKIDRKALPAPSPACRDVDDQHARPRNHTEALLVTLWAEVLKVDRVGIKDNFFALGGHSVVAAQLTNKIAAAFGVSLPIRRLFLHPTIDRLAPYIQSQRKVSHVGVGAERLPA